MTILSLTTGASPQRLVRLEPGQLQHNAVEQGRIVPVDLSGQILSTSTPPLLVRYQVFDQFHHDMPRGTIKVLYPFLNRNGPGLIYTFERRIALNLQHPITTSRQSS